MHSAKLQAASESAAPFQPEADNSNNDTNDPDKLVPPECVNDPRVEVDYVDDDEIVHLKLLEVDGNSGGLGTGDSGGDDTGGTGDNGTGDGGGDNVVELGPFGGSGGDGEDGSRLGDIGNMEGLETHEGTMGGDGEEEEGGGDSLDGTDDLLSNQQFIGSGGGGSPSGSVNNNQIVNPFRITGITGKAVTNNPNEKGVNLNLFNTSDPRYKLANMTNFNGKYYAVGSHGTSTSIELPDGTTINATAFATELLSNPALHYTSGTPIWLIGCSTGGSVSSGNNFAQELANILGVEVVASDKNTTIDPTTGDIKLDQDGHWISFYKGRPPVVH